jgi:hypothetical protein
MISPVAGLLTASVAPLSALTHAPLIKHCARNEGVDASMMKILEWADAAQQAR